MQYMLDDSEPVRAAGDHKELIHSQLSKQTHINEIQNHAKLHAHKTRASNWNQILLQL